MSIRANRTRSFRGFRWPAVPRDYLARRRYFQKISIIVVTALLSVIVAGAIIYASTPGGFDPGH